MLAEQPQRLGQPVVVGQVPDQQLAQSRTVRIAVGEREQDRQRTDALPEVGSRGLAGGCRIAGDVDEVVGELEGHAIDLAECGHSLDLLSRRTGQHGAEPRRCGDQRRRLVGQDLQVVLDRVGALRRAGCLGDLPLHQPGEGAGLDMRRLRAERGREVGGAGEQVVAGKDGDRVGPAGVGAPGTPPYVRLVHDVVVVERGKVGELDDDGRIDDVRRARIAEVAGEQGEHGPDPLAPGLDQMAARQLEQG